MSRRAFTLLEVIIALAILAVGLTVLVSSQASAVLMTTETDRMRVATLLAQEKMNEAMMRIEAEGWSSQTIEEEGDFADFGDEDFRGSDAAELELGDSLEEFRWAYTIREIELDLPDLGGAMDTLGANDYFGDGQSSGSTGAQAPTTPSVDQSMFSSFLSPDMISEQLSPYLREVRVLVWWGENEDETDQVELVTHAINPSGQINDADDQDAP